MRCRPCLLTCPLVCVHPVRSRILIIENPQASSRCGICPADSPEWENARRTTWDSFTSKDLRDGRFALVIADAVSGCGKALEFFHHLRDDPLPVPVFAVLPGE